MPGARAAFDDGLAAECLLPRLRNREWAKVDDILFFEENHYHVTESYIETTYTFVRDGTAPTRKGVHWVYTVREIRLSTKEAGFETRDLLLSLEREPFEVGSPSLLAVAERASTKEGA